MFTQVSKEKQNGIGVIATPYVIHGSEKFTRLKKGRITKPVVTQRLLGKIESGNLVVDLDAHENAGGHTIARHVGKDSSFIANRVIDDQLDAASTFVDKDEATRVVKAALEANASEINSILWSPKSGPANRAFTYDAGTNIGEFLEEGNVMDKKGRIRGNADRKKLKTGATSATLVIKILWQNQIPHKYYVLTCYPNPPA